MRQVSASGIAVGALLLFGWLLSGCSPEMDWRELHSAEGRFKVLMPARPSQATGADAAGHVQVLWTAEAGAILFSAGYTDYGDSAQNHMQEVRDALMRASRGRLAAESAVPAQQPAGLAFSIQGAAADGSARQLEIRLIPRGNRLYQLAIIGKPGAAGETEADMFLGSLKLE